MHRETPENNRTEEVPSGGKEEGTSKRKESPDSSSKHQVLHVWDRATQKYIKKPILRALVFVARTAAIYPGRTVFLGIAVSVALVVTGLFTNFRISTNQKMLWTPTGSLAERHGAFVDAVFPSFHRSIEFVLHLNGDNVLTLSGAQCLFDVVDTIRATEKYKTTCFTSWGLPECPLVSATKFFNHNRSVFLNEINTLVQENDSLDSNQAVQLAMSPLEFSNGERVVRSQIFGFGNDKSNKNSTQLHSALSFLGFIPLSSLASLPKGFEENVIENVYALDDRWAGADAPCVVEIYDTASSFDAEVKRGIYNDVKYLAIAFIMMCGFCALYFTEWSSCVESQSILGLGAVATICCSIMTSFGIMFCIGVPFHSITQVFPYVMVGIGLDDTFIIHKAFLRTDLSRNFVERVVEVMQDVGISIAFSSSTTVLAFFLGAASSYPIIRYFCWYAATTVAIDFFYQVSLFIGILAYNERRVKARHYDCIVCLQAPQTAPVASEAVSAIQSANAVPSNTAFAERQSLSEKLMHHYSRILLHPTTKLIVPIVFTAILAVGVIGVSRQSQQLDFRQITPTDSYIRDYYDAKHTYSSPEGMRLLQAGIYFRDVNFSLPEVRQEMNNYINEIVNIPYISSQPDNCWVRDFEKFASPGSLRKQLPFEDQIGLFLQTEPYSVYTNDVIRDENGTVVATRCYVTFDQTSLFDSKMQIDTLHSEREVSQSQSINKGKSEWPFFMYGEMYTAWEFYDTVVGEVILNVVLGLVSVFIISLLFIPHPIGALLLTPVVAAIYCELVAVLHFANITINGVSITGLTMSIGLVVDYNAHMVLTYTETSGTASRNERVHKVLTTMGTSILLGAFTTLLGVIPLSMSDGNIFRTFFFTFLGITGLSSVHGLIFIPVVLSLVGPHCPMHEKKRCESSDTEKSEFELGQMGAVATLERFERTEI